MVSLKISFKFMSGLVFAVIAFLIFPASMDLAHSEPVVERVDAELLADAIRTAEEIDAMRSALATTIDPKNMEVDQGTFSRVCKPVGKRAKQIATEKGWEFRQLTIKYRNPKNKADAKALNAIDKFKRESKLQGFWSVDGGQKRQGLRYFKRITVEPACLNCHGEKKSDPNLLKTSIPMTEPSVSIPVT